MTNKFLNMMLSRRVWPVVAVAVAGATFLAVSSIGNKRPNGGKQEILLQAVGAILQERHYSPKPYNDEFSRKVYTEYLDKLDGDKGIFTQEDLKSLSRFEDKIDDELQGAPLQFHQAVATIYRKRIDENETLYKKYFSQPFEFTTDESIQLDGDKLKFAANDAEKADRWRKRCKYLVLDRYSDLVEARRKARELKGNNWKEKDSTRQISATAIKYNDSISVVTDVALEAEARKRALKGLERNFSRSKSRFTDQEFFNSYVNTITELMDPHTEYMAPQEKRAFDEAMSGSFFGIGAQLQEKETGITITSVVTGSPAWKSQQIQANDVIIKVGQNDQAPVDISGFAVDEAVKLIRGEKGSVVSLTIRKPDGTQKVVKLQREKIDTDETFARSTVITQPDGKKVGYIYLPEFYADFYNEQGRRCAADVAAELMKLKAEGIEGVILDLRNNGGGSLYDVINMVGLFIKQGPVVQVKDKVGKPMVLNDTDPSVLYDGPLAVMVNEFSASASEIFAAAIQDYKRGIVVGSTSTFGKGTVQKSLPLGRPLDNTGRTDMGALKLTFEMFYRINGGSTQLRGVASDVVLPDVYEYLQYREKDNPNALPWNQITPAPYAPVNVVNVASISNDATARIRNTPLFSELRKNVAFMGERIGKEYSLNLVKFQADQKKIREVNKRNEELLKLKNPLAMQFMKVDAQRFYENPDQQKKDRSQAWLKAVSSDIYVGETANIVSRMYNGRINELAGPIK